MNAVLARALPSRYVSPYPPRAHGGIGAVRVSPPRFERTLWLEQHGSGPAPLWRGAWVGWLTCQAVLVLLVESTDLAADPRIALVTRSLVLTAFVAAFRKPCFVTQAQRHAFTLCVLAAEIVIAACCERLSGALGWPLWTLLAAALSLLATSLGGPGDSKDAARSNRFTVQRQR